MLRGRVAANIITQTINTDLPHDPVMSPIDHRSEIRKKLEQFKAIAA